MEGKVRSRVAARRLSSWLVLLLLWGCGGAGVARTPDSPLHGRVVEVVVHGRALEGNLLGDSPDRTITVYLPPGYAREPSRHYPVIYSLGGFQPPPAFAKRIGPHPEAYLFAAVDRAIGDGTLGEVVVVNVEGWNRLGGSFWVNSRATGGWEDFITHDVIAAIDARFRTLASRDSRGLYGGSMGGFGAISIAMHRPDLFGAVFAQSPCCLALVEELGPGAAWIPLQQATLEQADALFRQGDPGALQAFALAAAFAPDPRRPGYFGDLPYRVEGRKVVPDEPGYSRWLAQLPGTRLDKEGGGLKTLHGFRIQYGDHDELRHIPVSVPAFHQALLAHGVQHEFHYDHGGHMDTSRFGRDALPFFARTLAGAGIEGSKR